MGTVFASVAGTVVPARFDITAIVPGLGNPGCWLSPAVCALTGPVPWVSTMAYSERVRVAIVSGDVIWYIRPTNTGRVIVGLSFANATGPQCPPLIVGNHGIRPKLFTRRFQPSKSDSRSSQIKHGNNVLHEQGTEYKDGLGPSIVRCVVPHQSTKTRISTLSHDEIRKVHHIILSAELKAYARRRITGEFIVSRLIWIFKPAKDVVDRLYDILGCDNDSSGTGLLLARINIWAVHR